MLIEQDGHDEPRMYQPISDFIELSLKQLHGRIPTYEGLSDLNRYSDIYH
jgi:hypothetical protein